MAIRVNRATSAGAVAAAAFGGAQGQARAQLRAQGLAVGAREREAERQRQFQAQQAELARRDALDRMALGQSFQQDNMRLNAGLQNLLAEGSYSRQQDAADLAQIRGREDLEFGLTTRQRMELEQIANAEAQALADPQFSSEEKEELRYKFAQRRAGLQPVARPKPESAAERFKRNTFTDPKTGRVYALDADGLPGKVIYEPPERQATVADRVNAWKAALTAATNAEGGVDEAKAKRLYQAIMAGTEIPIDEPGDLAPAPAAPAPATPGEPGWLESIQRIFAPEAFDTPAVPAANPAPVAPTLESELASVEEELRLARQGPIEAEDARIGVVSEIAQTVSGPAFTAASMAARGASRSGARAKASRFYPDRPGVPRRAKTKAEVAALEKRRDALIAKKDEAEARQIFLESLRRGVK